METNDVQPEIDSETLRDNPIVEIAFKHGLIGSVAVSGLIKTIGEMYE
jgi:hypothetical protein